jgi:formate hydrogenlyase subunit 3/multisubunit Na+/H+ antiporter MnhD subunit
MNTILLFGFYLPLNLIERGFDLNLNSGTFIIIEIILLVGLIVSLFSKDEFVAIVNENLFDGIILLILLGLMGLFISSNIIAIFSCFILVIMLVGVIFYFGNYPKEYKLLKLYFAGIGISILLLFIASYLIFFEFNTLVLTDIVLLQKPDLLSVILSTLLLLAIGIPCGLIPFSIYHLKSYYQDSSYTNLLLYSIFSFVNIFLIIRILNVIAFSLVINGILIMVISCIGLIISEIFILSELFTTLDGDTFSIKKLFGFSISADFNMFLLFSSYLVFLTPLQMIQTYFNHLIFYFLMISSIKTLIFYTFYPIMLETYDDNLKLLGELRKKYRIFGIIFFISGIIITFPLSILSFNSLLITFSTGTIANISLFSILTSIIFVFFVGYLSITLIFISVSHTQIYHSNKPRYIERESVKSIKSNHYIPIIIIIVIIGCLSLIYFIGDNLYYNLFKSYFLFLD